MLNLQPILDVVTESPLLASLIAVSIAVHVAVLVYMFVLLTRSDGAATAPAGSSSAALEAARKALPRLTRASAVDDASKAKRE